MLSRKARGETISRSSKGNLRRSRSPVTSGLGSLGKSDQVVVGGIAADWRRRRWVGSALGEGDEVVNEPVGLVFSDISPDLGPVGVAEFGEQFGTHDQLDVADADRVQQSVTGPHRGDQCCDQDVGVEDRSNRHRLLAPTVRVAFGVDEFERFLERELAAGADCGLEIGQVIGG